MTPASPGSSAGQAVVGVRIAGVGSFTPDRRLTNADLERLMDTSDEWIVQRTGIRERRQIDPHKGENTSALSSAALASALADARMDAAELDLVIVATCTPDMRCPATACRAAHAVGAVNAAAFDVNAACSGWVFALNTAHAMIRQREFNTVAVIGCDTLTRVMDYSTRGRGCAILFGDAAGAVIIKATDDTSKGMIAQAMRADGSRWSDLYIPEHASDFPRPEEASPEKLDRMQMRGREVFRFAVGAFPNLIEETLNKAGVKVEDVSQFICHQSNARILEAARKRFGIPEDKLYVNIDRFGNTSSGSVPLCLDELRKAGKLSEGELIMFVAFGGGMTWGSSLWRL